jgi:hypothetical protein
MNYVEKMFDITLFVNAGDLGNKAFEPQLFVEAVNEIETGNGAIDLITMLSQSKDQRVQKRAKKFVLWFREFVKSNPYNPELIFQTVDDPTKFPETLQHMKDFYNWGLISKQEFKKTLIDCCKLQTSKLC